MKNYLRFVDGVLVRPVLAVARNKKRANLGFGSGILILMFFISFALYLSSPCATYSSVFFQFVQANTSNCALESGAAAGTQGTVASVTGQLDSVFGSLGLLTGGALIAFAVGFPNGYAIFAAVAYFLLGAFTIPTGIFNASSSLPLEIRVLLITVFSLLNIFAVLEYLGAKRY